MSEPQVDYDNPWKEAIEQYFEAFLAFFFPEAHTVIDWNRPAESLDKELQQIVREAEVGKRLADKLFKVWRLEGEEAWVLVHIEVQSQEESDFAERMYVYNYRCFDRYRQPVISLAVLGDERAAWRPSFYGYALGGCEVSLKFPVAKLLDYETQWQSLEESTNPFAVIVMAHLKTKATRGVPRERKQWKWSIVRRLFEGGYSREKIVRLFRLIDWMMILPEELQQEFREELRLYQEDSQMPLLSRIELAAKQEGILQTARENVLEVLEVRFEVVPSEVIEAVNRIEDTSLLKQLLRQAIAIPSIAEFQQLLEQPPVSEENSAEEI
ncbi:MAG: transposase [Cyanobacteriota bacterium]